MFYTWRIRNCALELNSNGGVCFKSVHLFLEFLCSVPIIISLAHGQVFSTGIDDTGIDIKSPWRAVTNVYFVIYLL